MPEVFIWGLSIFRPIIPVILNRFLWYDVRCFFGDPYRAGVGSQIYTMGSVLMFSLEARKHGASDRGWKRLESLAINRYHMIP
jgi:hypothetical protein